MNNNEHTILETEGNNFTTNQDDEDVGFMKKTI